MENSRLFDITCICTGTCFSWLFFSVWPYLVYFTVLHVSLGVTDTSVYLNCFLFPGNWWFVHVWWKQKQAVISFLSWCIHFVNWVSVDLIWFEWLNLSHQFHLLYEWHRIHVFMCAHYCTYDGLSPRCPQPGQQEKLPRGCCKGWKFSLELRESEHPVFGPFRQSHLLLLLIVISVFVRINMIKPSILQIHRMKILLLLLLLLLLLILLLLLSLVVVVEAVVVVVVVLISNCVGSCWTEFAYKDRANSWGKRWINGRFIGGG